MIDPDFIHYRNWYKWPGTIALAIGGVVFLVAWALGYPMPWEG